MPSFNLGLQTKLGDYINPYAMSIIATKKSRVVLPGPRMSTACPVVRGTGDFSTSVILGCNLKPGWRASVNAKEAPAIPAPEMRMFRGCCDMIIPMVMND